MKNLFSFTRRNTAKSITTYEAKAAGEFVAQLTCRALSTIGQHEYAEIIAGAAHEVNGALYDEEHDQWDTFEWTMTLPADIYRRLPTPESREVFTQAIFALSLPVLHPLTNIFVELEHADDDDWRSAASAAASKARASSKRVISGETIAEFKSMINSVPLRHIHDAFHIGGITEGAWDGFDSGERRTLFMNYISSVDQAKGDDTQNLFRALSYLYGILGRLGRSDAEMERLRSRLEADGFPVEKTSARAIKPDEPTTTNLVDEVIEYLRGVPRGIRELSPEHRYGNGKRNYGHVDIRDEFDLQDFVRAFLRIRFPHASVENPTGQVAGLGGRVDFALGPEKIMIELKMLKTEGDWSAMFKDITSKFERYSPAPGCDNIIVFVYDPTQCLRSAYGAEMDLTKHRTIGERRFNSYLVVSPKA